MHGKARGFKLNVTYGMQVWSVFRRFLSCYEHKINATLRGFFYHLFSVIDACPAFSTSFCTSGYLRVTGGYICWRPELRPCEGPGSCSPRKFEVLDSRRCIFVHFQVFFCCFVVSFFAPKSTNLNKFEENYVTMK